MITRLGVKFQIKCTLYFDPRLLNMHRPNDKKYSYLHAPCKSTAVTDNFVALVCELVCKVCSCIPVIYKYKVAIVVYLPSSRCVLIKRERVKEEEEESNKRQSCWQFRCLAVQYQRAGLQFYFSSLNVMNIIND